MRLRFLGSIILLQCAAASAGTVIVEPPVTRLVSTLEQLRDRCDSERRFDACATFIAYRLRAQCSARDGLWILETSAAFRPWITLYNIRQLPHEQEHIRDVEKSVEGYLAELESLAFSDRESCAARSAIAGATFGEKMAAFARASNQRMH
jgi:hypothetical protein